jgi:predicted nucleotidyltransferase component of viral defense system
VITLQEIIPWRATAPWANDLMVEQDYLLSQAVELIFKDQKLSRQLAMRGGTVLHKGHLAPSSRYSEDIDLVLVANRSHKGIREDLTAVLKPLLGRPVESLETTVRLAVRNLVSKSKIARLVYRYSPASPLAAMADLKVEVNLNEQKSLYPLTSVDIDVPSSSGPLKVPVVSYDLDEMLGTKLRALLQRDHGRDLFDLWHAWSVSQAPGTAAKVNPARVGEAFRFYMDQEGSKFSRAEFASELALRMSSEKFLRDMEGFLPAGRKYDPHVAYQQFCEVYLPHL